MQEKPLNTLEYNKILSRLAEQCSYSVARELAFALRPSIEFDEVRRLQSLTAEARKFLSSRPSSGIGGARDIRAVTEKSALGGALTPGELLDVQSTLDAAGLIRHALSRMSLLLPLLYAISEDIQNFSSLSAQIGTAINARGEVNDNASPALLEIRRQVRLSHDRLQQRLQEMVSALSGRQVLQEPIVTQRDGRYVVPVKSDFRGAVPGIVHDVSQSGATLFVEPIAIVEIANRWRELQIEEEHEVERILRALSGAVGEASDAILLAVDALAAIDLAMAKARLGDIMRAHELPYDGDAQTWIVEGPGELRLFRARHPLLSGNVVPIDLTVGDANRVLLITGPNTGGKTVALKTAGLLALMAQSGLPVPADRGTQIPVFTDIFADIGDEQSIEQSLSTFSSHMRNIIGIVDAATPTSLVLLDELAAGTDPVEGSALAEAILTHLLQEGASVIATTHHGSLKTFAHNTPGVLNASVEFNTETLAPTYHLRLGLPGSSNALAIARRLGMPEGVLDLATASLPEEHVAVEQLLDEIQRERVEANAAHRAEEMARREAEEIRMRLEERLDATAAERDRILDEAQDEAARLIERVTLLTRETEQRLARAQRAEELREATAAVSEAESHLAAAKRRRPRRRRRAAGTMAPVDVQAGDMIWLRGLGRAGEALSAPDDRSEVEISLGSLRTRVRVDQIERVERSKTPRTGTVHYYVAPAPIVPLEIEVRGQRLEEAMPKVEQYVDDAFRAGLPWVRIIHGKGTGTMRRAVRDMLAKNPLVKDFDFAERQEGGEGVTVAHFVS